MTKLPPKGTRAPTARELLSLIPSMRRAARRAGARGEAVNDIVSETIMAALASGHGFRGWPDRTRRASLRAWVCVIARNNAVSYRRHAALEARTIKAYGELVEVYDDGSVRQAEARLVLARVELLPPKLRALVLAFAEKGTLEGAAVLLKLANGTAASRWRKAQERMRRSR